MADYWLVGAIAAWAVFTVCKSFRPQKKCALGCLDCAAAKGDSRTGCTKNHYA